MTPDWPELWQREPGLIPEQVSFLADHEYLRPSFDAACRDAAVRWLLKQREHPLTTTSLVLMSDKPDDVAEFWVELNDVGQSSEELSLDAALFVACKSILDERPTSSSSAP